MLEGVFWIPVSSPRTAAAFHPEAKAMWYPGAGIFSIRHRIRPVVCGALLSSVIIVSPCVDPIVHAAGLYDSDAAAAKGGDLKDRDYWRAKWDSVRLEEALKERQPEGAILIAVIGQTQLLGELAKKYPNDEDFEKWKARAEDIKAKIDPDADRREQFKPGCLWAEVNYREAFVNYNYAKTAIDQKDWETAQDGLREADRNLQILQARISKGDRVAAWPDGAAQWVKDASAETVKMQDEVKAKLK
jgi:hypothetical protein